MYTRANKYDDVTAQDTEEIFQQIYDLGVGPTQTQLSVSPTISQIDLVQSNADRLNASSRRTDKLQGKMTESFKQARQYLAEAQSVLHVPSSRHVTPSRVSEDSTLVDQMISSPPAVPALDISFPNFHGLPTPRERKLTTCDDSTNRQFYVTVAPRLLSYHPSRMHNQKTHSSETARLLTDTSTPRETKKEAPRENATDNAPKENPAVNSTSTLKDLKLQLELIISYSPNKTIMDWVSENLNLIKHGNGTTPRYRLILKALVKELKGSNRQGGCYWPHQSFSIPWTDMGRCDSRFGHRFSQWGFTAFGTVN